MSRFHSNQAVTLDVAALERIDKLCVKFEAAWQQGATPRIEAYLGETDGQERRRLLRELLLLELYYRAQSGARPSVEEYRGRFGRELDGIDQLCQEDLEGPAGEQAHKDTHLALDSAVELSSGGVSGVHLFQPGTRFGAYELLGVLGKGGMGVVYRAQQCSPERVLRQVALKVIRPDKLATYDPEQQREAMERFRSEAQNAARLEHDNIVPIYDVGEHHGQPYYSMRFVKGQSLDKVLRNRPLAGLEAAELFQHVARALHYAHEHKIVHRDLKPQNILVDQRMRPFIVDFGLAKWLEGTQELTQSGVALGTASYMSPEQAKGSKHVDHRTDVYSAGATLYELVTGSPPFRGSSVPETLHLVVHKDPVLPRQLNPKIDRDLETICLKCLEKEPDKRYPTAEELADDLSRYALRKPIQARPISRGARFWRWCRRNPLVAALTMLLTVALAAGTGGSSYFALIANTRASDAANRTVEAERARDEQQRQRVIADAHRFAAESQHVVALYPQRGLLLAVEAVQTTQRVGIPVTPVAEQALRDALEEVRGVPVLGSQPNIQSVALSPRGNVLATAHRSGPAALWHVQQPVADRPLIEPFRDASGKHVLLKHSSGMVRHFAISPDGRWLVIGDFDSPWVELWNLDAPQNGPTRCAGHRQAVYSVAFSPDARRLATAAADGRVALWSLTRGAVAGAPISWQAHQQAVFCVSFTPDGRRLITGSKDQTARLWDISGAAARSIATFPGHGAPVEKLAVSPDGCLLVTCDGDGEARLWDLTSERPAERGYRLPPHLGRIGDARFGGSDWLATASHDRTAHLYRLSPDKRGQVIGTYLLRGHESVVSMLAFTPDSSLLITASDDHTARLWNLRAPDPAAEPRVLRGHDGAVRSLDVDPHGRFLLTTSTDQSTRVWDLTQTEIHDGLRLQTRYGKAHVSISPATDPLFRIAVSPDNRFLVCFRMYGLEFLAFRLVNGRLEHLSSGRFDESFRALVFTPDARWLTGCDTRGQVRFWKLSRANPFSAPLTRSGHRQTALCAAVSSDSRWLVTGGADHRAIVWDLEAVGGPRQHAVLERHDSSVFTVAIEPGPNPRWIATGCHDGRVFLWDLRADDVASSSKQIGAHEKEVLQLKFSPDGRWLASGANDPGVFAWDMHAAKIEQPSQVLQNRAAVEVIAWTPNSQLLITGSAGDQTVRLWEANAEGLSTSPKLVLDQALSLPLPFGQTPLLALSGDGRYLLTSMPAGDVGYSPMLQDDGGLALWDLDTVGSATQSILLHGHLGRTISLAFSADNAQLFVGTDLGRLHVHELGIERLVQAAKHAAGRELTAYERTLYAIR